MWRIEADSRASPRRTIESNRQWQTPELKTANGRRNKMFGSYNYTAIYVARLVIYSVSDYYFPGQGCKLAVITEMRNWKRTSLECNSDTCARSNSTHLYFSKKNSQLHVAVTNIRQPSTLHGFGIRELRFAKTPVTGNCPQPDNTRFTH